MGIIVLASKVEEFAETLAKFGINIKKDISNNSAIIQYTIFHLKEKLRA